MSDFSIRGIISLDGTQVRNSVRLAEKDLRKFAADAKAATVATSQVGKGMASSFAGWATGVVSLSAMVSLLKEAVKYAGDIADASNTTGVNPQKFQEMSFAFQQSGGKTEDYVKSLSKIADLREKALSGDAGATDALNSVGISPEQARGMSGDQMFDAIAKKIRETKDETTQLAMATEYFGKSGKKLLPAIKDGFEEIRKEARKTGQVLTGSEVEGLDELGDAIDAQQNYLKVKAGKMLMGAFKGGFKGVWAELFKPDDVELNRELSSGEIDEKIEEFNKRRNARKGIKEPPAAESAEEKRKRSEKAAKDAQEKAARIDKLQIELAEKKRKLALDLMTKEERIAALKKEQAELGKTLTNDREQQLRNTIRINELSEEILRAQGPEKKDSGANVYQLTANQQAGAYVSDRAFSIQREQLLTLKDISRNTKPGIPGANFAGFE